MVVPFRRYPKDIQSFCEGDVSEIQNHSNSLQIQVLKHLPELATLERLLKSVHSRAEVEVLATVKDRGLELPIHGITFGSKDRSAPTLGIFGGVHGLERIGSEVVISYMQTISELLTWDETFHERLKHSRLVFVPIINPIGMYHRRRSNGNGVDLMRNSPTRAEKNPAYLVGGHQISNKLPWFMGHAGDGSGMEIESKALCNFVEKEIFSSKVSISVDVHSGFGSVDRLWFPYAKTVTPPLHLPEIVALKRLLDRSYPNHFYQIEPQAKSYTTHGDLWDWLYDLKLQKHPTDPFLPLTLELGSWMWLKKNPRQLFSSLGAFNPLIPHRLQRILRRHLTLFDFLHRAILSPASWTNLDVEARAQLTRRATELWYEPKK